MILCMLFHVLWGGNIWDIWWYFKYCIVRLWVTKGLSGYYEVIKMSIVALHVANWLVLLILLNNHKETFSLASLNELKVLEFILFRSELDNYLDLYNEFSKP